MQFAADWLAAYFVHSTIACVGALVIGRWLVREPAMRDLLWKACLVLPLATATIAVAMPSLATSELDLSAAAPHTAHVSVQPGVRTVAHVEVQGSANSALSGWIIALVLLPGAAAAVRLARRRRIFRHSLRQRKAVSRRALAVAPGLWAVRDRTLQVSVAPAVGSAAIIGAREICVSDAFLRLGAAERESVLAHEVAHIQRHDRAWIGLAEWLAAAFALQPLIRVVARRLRRDAEFICDDIAVRRTGNPLACVSALAAFAESHEAAAAVAYHSSQVIQRAERVLARRAAAGPATRWAKMGVAVAVTAFASGLLAAPHITTRAPRQDVRVQVQRSITASAHTQFDVRVGIAGR